MGIVVVTQWSKCLFVLIILSLVAFTVGWYDPKKRIVSLSCGVCLLVGAGWGAYQQHRLHHWVLPTALIKEPLLITGRVIDLPKALAHGVSFEFQTDQLQHQPLRVLLRLNWYRNQSNVLPGQHWRMTVKLKPPVGLYNPGGFDYQRWLIDHGFRATGYVVDAQCIQAASHFSIDYLRAVLQQQIVTSIHDTSIAALVAAVTVGSHALIDTHQWQIFQRTGTNHLMAISGLHVGMLAAAAFWIVGFLWRLYPRCCLWVPVQQVQAAMALLVAICYGALAGFSLPTQRAVIMVFWIMLALLLRRKTPVWRRLLMAFCLIIILDPFVLSSASLWLSFGSVFWIIYSLGGRLKAYRSWVQWLVLQMALLFGLAPFTLLYFQQLSLVALLANAIAVPYVGFIIVPLCFVAAMIFLLNPMLSHYLFAAIGWLMRPLWWYLQWCSQWPYAVWPHAIINSLIFITLLFAAFVLLMPRGIPGRWLSGIFLLPLLFYRPAGPKQQQVWMTVLDVGQGLAVVVRTAHYTLLYDAGPKSYSGFDAGAAVVVPFLRKQGIQQISRMVISHGDSDHIGGANAVLHALPVQQIMTSVPQRFRHMGAVHCYAGQHWQWDGVNFQMLSPQKHVAYHGNNSSCVLWIRTKQYSVLLTGDIERAVEHQLIHQYPALKATVVVVPHHGSRSSSSLSFVKMLQPKVVIFPTGPYNRFHFPASSVVGRYQSIASKMFNTAWDGAVLIKIDKKITISNRHKSTLGRNTV